MLNWVEHEKSFITSGPGSIARAFQYHPFVLIWQKYCWKGHNISSHSYIFIGFLSFTQIFQRFCQVCWSLSEAPGQCPDLFTPFKWLNILRETHCTLQFLVRSDVLTHSIFHTLNSRILLHTLTLLHLEQPNHFGHSACNRVKRFYVHPVT